MGLPVKWDFIEHEQFLLDVFYDTHQLLIDLRGKLTHVSHVTVPGHWTTAASECKCNM